MNRPSKTNCIRTLTITIFILSITGLIITVTGAADGKHTLWEVKGETNTVYLLGSIHVLTEEAYPLAQPLMDAFLDTKKIVFETDVEATFSEEVNQYVALKGYYPDGENLWESLDEESSKRLRTLMKKLKLPALMFHRMKPWQVTINLVVTMYQAEGFLTKYGVDKHFHTLAKETEKTITFFEPVMFQLKLFGELSDREQVQLLKQILDDQEKISKLAADMFLYWKTGDAEKLNILLSESLEDYPYLADRLLYQRNKNWIPDIESFLKEKENVLVVVGAGHLVGPGSVVELLQKKGYAIRQL